MLTLGEHSGRCSHWVSTMTCPPFCQLVLEGLAVTVVQGAQSIGNVVISVSHEGFSFQRSFSVPFFPAGQLNLSGSAPTLLLGWRIKARKGVRFQFMPLPLNPPCSQSQFALNFIPMSPRLTSTYLTPSLFQLPVWTYQHWRTSRGCC